MGNWITFGQRLFCAILSDWLIAFALIYETKLHYMPLLLYSFMSFDLVLFGGTGDLAWRKLMPALFQAFRHGSLPKEGRIIGVARDALDAW